MQTSGLAEKRGGGEVTVNEGVDNNLLIVVRKKKDALLGNQQLLRNVWERVLSLKW